MNKYNYKLHEIGTELSEDQVSFLIACAQQDVDDMPKQSTGSARRPSKRGRKR
jgi:hypothetical protein